MEIRLCQNSDHTAWDDYVRKHPKGTFFHLSGWKEVVEDCFGHKSHYLLAVTPRTCRISSHRSSDFRIVGVLPLFSLESLLFGRSIVSLPFATYGGILADNADVEQALYERAVALTQEKALDYFEIRNESGPVAQLPIKDLYYGFKKDIFSDNDQNLKAIPRKTRRMVRKGMKNNLNARFGGSELVDQFYELFAHSYRSLGTPVFSKQWMKNILQQFGADSSILIIYRESEPLSGVLSFYFKDQVIPYYSGAYPDSRKFAANDYLYWALMSNAANRGCRVFDFGRSKKDTGSYHFKRHWGFEPRPLRYQYYLNKIEEIPNISPANPKYQRLIQLWKKLPLWATKIIGPRIVKYIP